MKRLYAKNAAAILLGATVMLAARLAPAQTFVSEFETGFDGWQQQWHKESSTGTEGVVSHSTVRGHLDSTSLKFDMGDGYGDDGTLWIEKPFAVSTAMPTQVDLGLQLFNPFRSDFNAFEVKAYIDAAKPEWQTDFELIGSTNSVEGWVPFSFSRTVSSPTGQVWVALGIRVAWESHRDYWIDRVTVSMAATPEPTTAALLLLGSAVAPLRWRRSLRRGTPRAA